MVFNIHWKRASFCWVIESLYKFILNLPTHIMAIYTTNITKCSERIPLEGRDNLHEALGFIVLKGFSKHNRSAQQHSIWVHINTESSLIDCAKWKKKRLGSTCWIELSYDSILMIQSWLINNCYIRLGDAIWRQGHGSQWGFHVLQYGVICILWLMKFNSFPDFSI